MKKSVQFGLIAAALTAPMMVVTPVGSAPAYASEPPLGSRLGNRLKEVPNGNINADRSAYRVAECKANRRPVDARRYLDARTAEELDAADNPLSRKEYCSLNAITSDPVERVSIQTEQSVYRGMLAETLVKNDRDAEQLTGEPIQPIYDRDWFAMTGRASVLDEMAVCMVSVDPAPVLELFKTLYDSKEQSEAIGALGPLMGQCLAAGVKLEANALSLRTALGEAMYHRLFDPPVEQRIGENAASKNAGGENSGEEILEAAE